jgi:hypothetical protein
MKYCLVVLLVLLLVLPITPTYAQSISFTEINTTLAFPEELTFSARVSSPAAVERVILEYGVEKQTCGTVVARAFPALDPATGVATWTWQMRQSGSEPPGTTIWYRWLAVDRNGTTYRSDEQRLTWLDSQHQWRTINREQVNLHWYDGSEAFANELLASATDSLARLGQTTGVTTQNPVNVYVYPDPPALREAVLYQPGWTGGLAFGGYGIVALAVGEGQMGWGRRVMAHELTHVLVGYLANSCVSSIPTWLNEGIAVYGEGGLDPESQRALQIAINSDQVLSVRALSGGFSEDPSRASLSYAQSFSLVDFLIRQSGQTQLLQLFDTLRRGEDIDSGLQQVYGFDVDGLEDRWRAAVNAQPRTASDTPAQPTAQPTIVPTYAPIAAAPRPIETSVPAPPGPTTELRPAAATTVPITNPTTAERSQPAARNNSLLWLVAGVALLIGGGLVVLGLSRLRRG